MREVRQYCAQLLEVLLAARGSVCDEVTCDDHQVRFTRGYAAPDSQWARQIVDDVCQSVGDHGGFQAESPEQIAEQ